MTTEELASLIIAISSAADDQQLHVAAWQLDRFLRREQVAAWMQTHDFGPVSIGPTGLSRLARLLHLHEEPSTLVRTRPRRPALSTLGRCDIDPNQFGLLDVLRERNS